MGGHARLIENRAGRRVDASRTGKVEPLTPTLPIADVQEREAREIGRRAQPVAAVEKLRTTHRKQFLRAQPRDVEPGRGSVAVTNRKVDVFTREVDVMGRC